ncbi:hypothetical protein [Geoalkalibacter sp.]|uniref:hypothetical protein n=1 Tax=Geoalkalibacter sp. TaxID=3041440 RepID=UPI00272DF353|nr:hypothetical protein [Geoalkalibacter sp.]
MSSPIRQLPPHLSLSEDEQGRRFLNFFVLSATLSFLVILTLSALGAYLTFQHYILAQAQERSVRLSKALLQQDRDTLVRPGPEGLWEISLDTRDFDRFDARMRPILEALQVAKIKIYDARRTIVYSNDLDIIGLVDEKNLALDRALRGEIDTKIAHKGEFWDLDEELRLNIDVAETYIPIFDDHGRVIGSYEIYLDVSRYRQDVRSLVVVMLGILGIILGVIFLVIHTQLRKAAGIIHAKSQQIKVLSGLLPVCSFCKKIRNDKNEWEAMEEYISARSESEFSHSFCPECVARHYPDLNLKDE